MNKKEILNVLDSNDLIKEDDWTLAEIEEGVILLQRKNNKTKATFRNLKSK